jgi:hypothetical protein
MKNASKITILPDCGNSTRKRFISDFYIALYEGDMEFLTEVIPDDIKWKIAGQKAIISKEKFLIAIQQYELWKPKELTLTEIITHGYEAAVSGELITKDNKDYSFCDIYRYKRASGYDISLMKSFLAEE